MASAVSSKMLTSTFSVGTPFLVVTGGALFRRNSVQQDDRLTFPPAANTLHTNEHFDTRDFIASINVVLQRDKSIELLAFSISEGSLTQDTFVAFFLHHEIAAIISLGEDGGN